MAKTIDIAAMSQSSETLKKLYSDYCLNLDKLSRTLNGISGNDAMLKGIPNSIVSRAYKLNNSFASYRENFELLNKELSEQVTLTEEKLRALNDDSDD